MGIKVHKIERFFFHFQNMRERLLLALAFSTALYACTNFKQGKASETLFESVDTDLTGISFNNTITETDSLNLLTFEYIYIGGGVGIGDFNSDSLPDIFFVGNMVPSRLYINKGGFKFEDVTEPSGIAVSGWPFGVAVADVNGDGLQDIYLSMGGAVHKGEYQNKLFINEGTDKNGIPHFKEQAFAYKLDEPVIAIQSLFFDYDRDGDLDMYMLTGGGYDRSPIVPYLIRKDGSSKNTDRLYRNDYDAKLGHPVFTNVSKEAHIVEEGYGLGVSLLDVNEDGWPDIYVTNDYLSNDLLYINNSDGTFTERAADYFNHTSHFAMGNDVGDINNDGLMDIVAVDMLPDKRYDRMLMLGSNAYDKFYFAQQQGYQSQYMRNTLQLNQGNGKFSEIGQLTGMYKTSWSWCPLFADVDNDGYQDLFITNGFGKDVTDLDFVKFREGISTYTRSEQTKEKENKAELLNALKERPGIKSHPYLYKNNGDFTFSDKSEQWGFGKPVYTNGAAYVDLDNDGDLDLVTNTINEPPHVFRNKLYDGTRAIANNYLRIKLTGPQKNSAAIGSVVTLKYNNQKQVRYQSSVRGFESSVESVLHFGLGSTTTIDTVEVTWPDGKQSILANEKSNQVLCITYAKANSVQHKNPSKSRLLFSEVSATALNIDYRNTTLEFNDFNFERLLPKKYSMNGQGLAVGDVNGDGLEDFFVGGGFRQAGRIFTQDKIGAFSSKPISEFNDGCEDAGSLLFDADSDGDLDLYIVSGGSQFTDENISYQDRFYKNDGKGNFVIDNSALPQMISSGSCVVAADYDKDGDLDLFVGGRIVPGKYPVSPKSYLLENSNGKFTDVSNSVAPSLQNIGMVTSALWTDVDNDNSIDLVVAGEWMPVTLFKNKGGKFINQTVNAGLKDTEGWWQSLVGGDFDNDGDMDFIGGNWGTNNPYTCTTQEPMSVRFNDFDKNGTVEPVISCYEDGVNYPVSSLDYMVTQMPSLKKRFLQYADYAKASTDKLLEGLNTKGMQTLFCKTLHSAYFENKGNGTFDFKNLPVEAQFAPLFGMSATDINHDGNLDLLAVGNFYWTDVVIGHYDALKGLTMLGDGKGNFKSIPISESGFVVDSDAKAMSRIETADNQSLYLITQNLDSIKIIKDNTSIALKRVQPTLNEVSAILYFKNGSKQKKEMGYGTSYLSQSSRSLVVDESVTTIELFDRKGKATRKLDYRNEKK
jgi:enediyne biosynthesis protein E4